MKDTVILVPHPGMGVTNDAPDLPIELINKYFTLLLEGHNFPAAIF